MLFQLIKDFVPVNRVLALLEKIGIAQRGFLAGSEMSAAANPLLAKKAPQRSPLAAGRDPT